MIGRIVSWLVGGGLASITEQIASWDLKRRSAANDAERIAAEQNIETLRMQRDLIIAEQRHAVTRWVRPALAVPVVCYWWKLIIWDTLLGWGSTPYAGDHIAWFVTLIPTAYFLARPFEKATR